MNTCQDLIDTYNQYERELEAAEANVRRLRNRMMRLAVQLDEMLCATCAASEEES
jgi:hypothetical protein